MSAVESPLAEALTTAIEHLKHERLDSAEPVLARVLERWPGQPDALHFLGVLRHAQGDTGTGIECIRAALAGIPDHAGAWTTWAICSCWKAVWTRRPRPMPAPPGMSTTHGKSP